MSWLSNVLNSLANLLSGGALEQYQQQTVSIQARLQNNQTELERVKAELQQFKRDWEQSQAQVQQLQRERVQLEQAGRSNWLDLIRQKKGVLAVERCPLEDPELLWGFVTFSPQPKTQVTGGSIIINGWVLGKKAPATKLVITCDGQLVEETPANLPRPGVKQRYPDVPEAEKSGFTTSIAVAGMPPEAELLLQAVLADDTHVPLAVIRLS